MTNKASVIFCCEGSPQIGLGHVSRCLTLAEAFAELSDLQTCFAMTPDTLGWRMVQGKGCTMLPADAFWSKASMNKTIDRLNPKAMILDVRDPAPPLDLAIIKNKGIAIAAVDDPSDRRLLSDFCFYPPVPQVRQMDWTGYSGQMCCGWQWVILRKEFCARALQKPSNTSPVVLVAMGGSDPAGLTLKTLSALDNLPHDFETHVILGAGFCHDQALNEFLRSARREYTLFRNATDMAGRMAQADLAVAAFGVTAYELAAMGVAAVHLCLTEDHAQSASALVEKNMALSLGVYSNVSESDISAAVGSLLENPRKVKEMAQNAAGKMDCQGARRICKKIIEHVGRNQAR